MNSRSRDNEPHVDYTVSGLTIDDMMRYDIKPEYKITLENILSTADDSVLLEHSYRNLKQYTNCLGDDKNDK